MQFVGEVNPWEVEKVITNLELTLEEMQQQAEMRGLIKGRVEGRAEGKIEKAQDAICKYLKRRFGDTSGGLQQIVQEITSLEILDGVMEELFAADTLE